MRDAAEAAALLDVLDQIREMYHRDRLAFNDRIRHAWRTLGPRVTAARMLREYMSDIYGPSLEQGRF
jgi:starch phosphorylase